ncbi:hypothetical protein ATANTOWER_020982 [Ataeniobius toweri]|uniref:Immunoglobulin V-set domain-containing protein n=1 Tax=Ataeniobius toweri TaxID=208326 RepID=A0ABU7C990_9TELE|nr:hypothetical protein [Ataeniobius toweri]
MVDLREGPSRLHVSRLRTEDSGLYLCNLKTDDGYGSAKCQIKVTAAGNFQPQRPTMNPQPKIWGRTSIYILVELTAALAVALLVTLRCCCRSMKSAEKNNTYQRV